METLLGWCAGGTRLLLPLAASDPDRLGVLLRTIDGAWDDVPYRECAKLIEFLRKLPAKTSWKDTRPLHQCFSAVHLHSRFADALPYLAEPLRNQALMEALGVVCEVSASTAVGILRLLSIERSVYDIFYPFARLEKRPAQCLMVEHAFGAGGQGPVALVTGVALPTFGVTCWESSQTPTAPTSCPSPIKRPSVSCPRSTSASLAPPRLAQVRPRAGAA